jgi:sulfate permease, SulP family
LSGAVLAGFVFGFGFGLIVDQTPKILGIDKADGSYFDVLVGVVKDISDTSMSTLTVGVLSIVLLLVFRRFPDTAPHHRRGGPGDRVLEPAGPRGSQADGRR